MSDDALPEVLDLPGPGGEGVHDVLGGGGGVQPHHHHRAPDLLHSLLVSVAGERREQRQPWGKYYQRRILKLFLKVH